jgi:hypothetical protein
LQSFCGKRVVSDKAAPATQAATWILSFYDERNSAISTDAIQKLANYLIG